MAGSGSAKTKDKAARGDLAGVEDYLALSAACVKQGAIDDAIATLRAAHARPSPSRRAQHLGGLLSRQGQHDEALAILRRVLAQSPNSAYAHSNLAVACVARISRRPPSIISSAASR